MAWWKSKSYEGPVERGSDGKLYRKGEAPHSKEYNERISKPTPNHEDYSFHSTLGSSKSSYNTPSLDSLFNEHGIKAKSSEEAYKQMKRRIKEGRMPLTDETVRFFREMGWDDLIDFAQSFVGPPPYSDENADWTYHYKKEEKRKNSWFGGKKSEAQIIAENIFNAQPDITMRGAARRLHPDKMPENYRQLANDTLSRLHEMIQERDSKK